MRKKMTPIMVKPGQRVVFDRKKKLVVEVAEGHLARPLPKGQSVLYNFTGRQQKAYLDAPKGKEFK